MQRYENVAEREAIDGSISTGGCDRSQAALAAPSANDGPLYEDVAGPAVDEKTSGGSSPRDVTTTTPLRREFMKRWNSHLSLHRHATRNHRRSESGERYRQTVADQRCRYVKSDEEPPFVYFGKGDDERSAASCASFACTRTGLAVAIACLLISASVVAVTVAPSVDAYLDRATVSTARVAAVDLTIAVAATATCRNGRPQWTVTSHRAFASAATLAAAIHAATSVVRESYVWFHDDDDDDESAKVSYHGYGNAYHEDDMERLAENSGPLYTDDDHYTDDGSDDSERAFSDNEGDSRDREPYDEERAARDGGSEDVEYREAIPLRYGSRRQLRSKHAEDSEDVEYRVAIPSRYWSRRQLRSKHEEGSEDVDSRYGSRQLRSKHDERSEDVEYRVAIPSRYWSRQLRSKQAGDSEEYGETDPLSWHEYDEQRPPTMLEDQQRVEDENEATVRNHSVRARPAVSTIRERSSVDRRWSLVTGLALLVTCVAVAVSCLTDKLSPLRPLFAGLCLVAAATHASRYLLPGIGLPFICIYVPRALLVWCVRFRVVTLRVAVDTVLFELRTDDTWLARWLVVRPLRSSPAPVLRVSCQRLGCRGVADFRVCETLLIARPRATGEFAARIIADRCRDPGCASLICDAALHADTETGLLVRVHRVTASRAIARLLGRNPLLFIVVDSDVAGFCGFAASLRDHLAEDTAKCRAAEFLVRRICVHYAISRAWYLEILAPYASMLRSLPGVELRLVVHPLEFVSTAVEDRERRRGVSGETGFARVQRVAAATEHSTRDDSMLRRLRPDLYAFRAMVDEFRAGPFERRVLLDEFRRRYLDAGHRTFHGADFV